MLEHTLDAASSILYLRPNSSLEKSDFAALASIVDPHIDKTGALAGIIVEFSEFPGWDSIGAMVAHMRFVRDHHERVKKIAVVTDSKLGGIAERFASHFVAAEIKQFPSGQAAAAKQWIAARG